ncbi:DUF2905 domain-containing protein [Dissulfurirhabdus thermomarina]|uniref:DUF2905 domain-containing protein n=1 Tax=Dissulfurirhabdus thermomarina TaxID=1765737 RepID=A0A6N9TQJ5_DISTH|nr:DUF2905 domain-containing protein [Dissulfurirhabdus thermomarina]NDY43449.1 DUF2905 domain-containing protein [Dissulfurirhabdus thermomarina]NMX22635.1 DUF2905 domain-containing protein [Dissulfurirhabdus thermomarina]
MGEIGRLLLFFGAAVAVVGLLLMAGSRLSFIGRLPGDILIRKGNFTFYFPLATSLLLSALLTLLLWILRK